MIERPAVRAVFFWIVFAMCDLGDAFLPASVVGHSAYWVGTGLALLASLVWWFVADARALGIAPSWRLRVGVVLLPPLAIPYYRFRYTGAVRGFRFVGLAILILVAESVVLLFVTGELP